MYGQQPDIAAARGLSSENVSSQSPSKKVVGELSSTKGDVAVESSRRPDPTLTTTGLSKGSSKHFSGPESLPKPGAAAQERSFPKFKFPNLQKSLDDMSLPAGLDYDDYSLTDKEEDKLFGTLMMRSHRSLLTQSTVMPNATLAALPILHGNVVIFGGYRGSTLRDTASNRQLWLPIRVGLNMRKVNFVLGLKDEDELKAHETIYADKMLDHVGPVDISRRLFMTLRSQSTCRVHDYGYDWRLSPNLLSEDLYNFLLKLDDEDPEHRGALLIAHSMGGLIAHHTLQKCIQRGRKSLINGIVYAGTPSQCSPIVKSFKTGEAIMLSRDVLTPKSTFTMRSSFIFFPEDGRCFVERHFAKEIPIDFYDPQNWLKYHLSPCVSEDIKFRKTQTSRGSIRDCLDVQECRDYLEVQLKRARRFREELWPIPDAAYPPMAVVYGNAIPTIRGGKVRDAEAIVDTVYKELWWGSGDGVVHRHSLMPIVYGYKPVSVVSSKHGHTGLLSDLNAVGKALAAILEAQGEKPVFPNSRSPGFMDTLQKIKVASARGLSPHRSFSVRVGPVKNRRAGRGQAANYEQKGHARSYSDSQAPPADLDGHPGNSDESLSDGSSSQKLKAPLSASNPLHTFQNSLKRALSISKKRGAKSISET